MQCNEQLPLCLCARSAQPGAEPGIVAAQAAAVHLVHYYLDDAEQDLGRLHAGRVAGT